MAKSKKRDDILSATLKLTADKGIHGFSTGDIAREADVGMGTIYNYFESKDILLTALFDELKGKFVNIIISNYDLKIDPYTNFKKIVFVLVKYYIENPEEFRYLERYSDSSLRVGKGLEESSTLVEQGASMLNSTDHNFKFKKLPPLVLFAMTYGPLVAIVNLVLMNKIELTDQLLNEVAESCWNSILDK